MKKAIIKRLSQYPLRPSARLMIAMARCHRRFIGIAALSSGIQAFSEAVSLGLIFMALELLGPNKDPGDSISRFTHLPSIVQPWVEGQSSDTILAITLALVIIVQGVQAASRYANGVSVELFAAACKAKVTNIVHKRLLGLSYTSTQKIRTGGLITITTDGPEAVRQKIEELAGLAVAVLLICAYIVVLVRISAWMLFLAIGLAGLVLFVQMVPLKRIRRYSTKASEQQALINSSLADDVRAIKLLQATGNLSYPHRRMAKMAGKLEQDLRRRAFVSQLSQPITQFLGVIAIALVIGGGAFILADRQTSVIASLATFVIALQRLSGKLIQIGQISSTLASNEGRLAQLDDFLSDRDNQMRREKGSILTRRSTPAKVEFIQVGFTYPGNKQPTLHQLNLTIKAGEIIGLVGSSGSGKTTIIDLLCELIVPSCGRILIDDTDLHTINPLSWQQQIGLVTQEPYVFYGTIAENLYMNGAMMDRSRALKCLEQVNLDELIKALPLGLDTFIGEGGQQLSGGQKQRLTIARALNCDARLLIFDEATSSLDMENEMVISELLNQLRGKMSILLVAHRLQSIQHANCIHVMEQGRIIESGSHAELIKENKRYAKLWNLQAGE